MLTLTSLRHFNLKLLVHKLQSIYAKQNQKQIMHQSNKLCMLQTGSVKKNKRNFINIIGDKFAMSIR